MVTFYDLEGYVTCYPRKDAEKIYNELVARQEEILMLPEEEYLSEKIQKELKDIYMCIQEISLSLLKRGL